MDVHSHRDAHQLQTCVLSKHIHSPKRNYAPPSVIFLLIKTLLYFFMVQSHFSFIVKT